MTESLEMLDPVHVFREREGLRDLYMLANYAQIFHVPYLSIRQKVRTKIEMPLNENLEESLTGFVFAILSPTMVSNYEPELFDAEVVLQVTFRGFEEFAHNIDEFSPEELHALNEACKLEIASWPTPFS
jgi:hypothetical protein